MRDWRLRLWQSWVDHRCALFGHQRRSISCYCAICRRFQVDWLISDGVKAMVLAVDRHVYDRIMGEVLSEWRTELQSGKQVEWR